MIQEVSRLAGVRQITVTGTLLKKQLIEFNAKTWQRRVWGIEAFLRIADFSPTEAAFVNGAAFRGTHHATVVAPSAFVQ